MIIDCHVHPWMPAGQMIAAARRNGIGRLCFFTVANRENGKPCPDDGWNPPPARVRASNDEVHEIHRSYPDETCALCFVNPRYPEESLEEIERCVARGPFLGVKLWISLRASDPRVHRVVEACAALGAPVLLHCWNKTSGNYEHESTTRDIANLAAAVPEATILAAHVTGQKEQGILDLAPFPNVLVDTSGGDPEVGPLEFALATLGADRILFGSDAPGRGFAAAKARVDGCSMTEADREKLFFRNFQRYFLGRKTHGALSRS